MIATVVGASLLLGQMPALGAVAAGHKDECLLYSKDCPCQTMTIQEKIARLGGELNKGSKVYTAAEITRLGDKLNAANKLLDTILYNHGTDNTW